MPGLQGNLGNSQMEECGDPQRLVDELLSRYGSAECCVAHELCDRYHPSARAYRIVAPDLTTEDLTYGELRHDSERFAAALHRLGIRSGDRVATLMGKGRAYLVTLMAIWRLGAVYVPLFTAFAPQAIAQRLRDSGAKLIVCDGSQAGKLDPGEFIAHDAPWIVVRDTDDGKGSLNVEALIGESEAGFPAAALGWHAPLIHIYTSGTTGKPKGVVVPVRALAAFRAYAELGLGVRHDDIFWCAADPGWAYGLYFGVLATFSTGVQSILLKGEFSASTTRQVLERERITNFAAAPTIYRSLLNEGATAAAPLALRCASSAGEPLTPEINEWAPEALGTAVRDHYGQTEAGMLINNHQHPALVQPLRNGPMGQQMPGWHAVILDSAEDREVGPSVHGRVAMSLADSPLAWFHGYDGAMATRNDKFSVDGRWYLTGDTGSKDENGYFYFSARDDDVIIMAGYRIGPFDLESTLLMHNAVAEAVSTCVMSCPNPIYPASARSDTNYTRNWGSVAGTMPLARRRCCGISISSALGLASSSRWNGRWQPVPG